MTSLMCMLLAGPGGGDPYTASPSSNVFSEGKKKERLSGGSHVLYSEVVLKL